MATPIELIVVGSINRDFVLHLERLPNPGETAIATSSSTGLGGKGANQAVAAAMVGTNTALIARIGPDQAGLDARSHLRKIGINDTQVVAHPTLTTGSAFITVNRAGENVIVVDPGANFGLSADEVSGSLQSLIATQPPGKPVVLTQGELRPDVVDRVSSEAQDRGLRFVLNLAPLIDISPATLLNSDPLVLNEGEANGLLRRVLASSSPPEVPEDIALALGECLEVPVVITLGERGAVVVDGSVRWTQPSPAPSALVDTTGAGDAFTGVLASALSRGRSLQAAVRLAVAAGSHAVSSKGTVSSYIDAPTLAASDAYTPSMTSFVDGGTVTQ